MDKSGKYEKNSEIFSFPDLKTEQGEIERVAQVYASGDPKTFIGHFLEQAKGAVLVPLTDELWSKLENTDSYDIPAEDWDLVEHHAVAGHPEHARDWRSLRVKIESGVSIDAPIVLKIGNELHLVSGNTRLMVARAKGIIPNVLLVQLF